jgi:NADPH:quinone reductase-like Zn-dependent oxidoreductase
LAEAAEINAECREDQRRSQRSPARGEHAALLRELGATPIDYQSEDFARVLPDGFDVVFDGIGEDGYGRSFAALKRGGLLCAYGYTAGVQAHRRMVTMLMWVARLYLWRWLPGAKRARGSSSTTGGR